MSSDTELCPACRHGVRPGATFCTQCGSPLNNRGARKEGNINHARKEALEFANRHGSADPGSISVVSAPASPMQHGTKTMPDRMPGPGGGTTMTTKLELAPASAGKRLGAAVLDWLGPFAVLATTFAIGIAGITQTRRNGFIVYDTGLLVLLGSIGLGVTVVYTFVLLGLEAKSGNTIGNQLMGIRSADSDGYAPGAGVVFVRGILTGGLLLLGSIVAVIFSALGLIGLLLWIALPLMFLGVVWAVLVVVSSAWDKNGKLRGWQDKAAKSLVFDVNAGRNPVTTGGIQGPYSFAPMDLPPVQPVASPVPSSQAPGVPHESKVQVPGQTTAAHASPAPAVQPSHDPNQWRPPSAPFAPTSAQAPSGSPSPAPAPAPSPAPPSTVIPQAPVAHAQAPAASPQPVTIAPQDTLAATAHPDDDVERTQMRPGVARAQAVLRIRIDDGQDVQLGGSVLLGRNPAPQPGEFVEQLLPVADPGRSISKTHLHLRVDGDGVWVTDRNSTNGSAVTTPDGLQTRLNPGEASFVRPGSTVHFGDRSFHLGQA
ncbi:RDD family protein [Paenarthrobacter aurescens]|nr:RDD family protein [Paenarthrobacter aurescens]MDO6142952.1 RDD family protein [Paenarthrobacter aurescens]MDO6146797.1 RDD family protein [Paenarthrobacter aurescens]MDO6158043.1 RDD family protein [Paenarthrobacter aurescens]MDO6162028.1 RDD family protein [Paenarthrobacter aurescens]